MRHIRFAAAVLVSVTALLVVFVVARHRSASSFGDSSPRVSAAAAVEVVRLSPAGDANNEVDCQSLAFVEFRYQVYNRSDIPIKGLKLGTKCGCEEAGTMPEQVLPGESAPISFRLRGPPFGKMQKMVPLLVEGTLEPAAVIEVSMKVQFEPPKLLPPPNGLSITFVKGDDAPRELVLEAIEAKEEERWIRGLELDAGDSIAVLPCEVEELPEADPDLTRRRYRFGLVNRSLPLGPNRAMATVRTRDNAPAVKEPLVIGIHVADMVAIAPNPLVIRYSRGSPPPARRVCVIDRRGNQAVTTPSKYDHDLLRVDAAGGQAGSTAVFDVFPLETPQSVLETQVVFNLGENVTRTLTVQFKPGKRL
jgi:hypothetical protein